MLIVECTVYCIVCNSKPETFRSPETECLRTKIANVHLRTCDFLCAWLVNASNWIWLIIKLFAILKLSCTCSVRTVRRLVKPILSILNFVFFSSLQKHRIEHTHTESNTERARESFAIEPAALPCRDSDIILILFVFVFPMFTSPFIGFPFKRSICL